MTLMSLTTRLLTLTAMLALVAAPTALAQGEPVPHRSLDMIGIARTYASENLPSDARMVLIGAIGNVEPAPGMMLTINTDSGTANAWAYIHYIPSQDRFVSVAVVDVPPFGPQIFETEPPTEIPASLVDSLRLADPFAGSGAMATRLMLDIDYLDFREKYPSVRADIVSYSDPTSRDSVVLPPAFPLDAPLWSVRFLGGGDSALICWVSGSTGESYCVRGAAAAIEDESQRGDATVIPNPATGSATVILPPGLDDESDVALYDATGRRVAAARRIERAGDAWQATVDVSELPAGTYYVAAEGARALARIVVAR